MTKRLFAGTLAVLLLASVDASGAEMTAETEERVVTIARLIREARADLAAASAANDPAAARVSLEAADEKLVAARQAYHELLALSRKEVDPGTFTAVRIRDELDSLADDVEAAKAE